MFIHHQHRVSRQKLLADAQAPGSASNRQAADGFAANVLPIVDQVIAAGMTTLRQNAEALNGRGMRTALGGDWHATTVWNLMARREPLAPQ